MAVSVYARVLGCRVARSRLRRQVQDNGCALRMCLDGVLSASAYCARSLTRSTTWWSTWRPVCHLTPALPLVSWCDLAPRRMFVQGRVRSLDEMKAMMRYNNWRNDPVGQQGAGSRVLGGSLGEVQQLEERPSGSAGYGVLKSWVHVCCCLAQGV